MDYLTCRRIEQRLLQIARQKGLNGTPWGDPSPSMRRVNTWMAAECLVLDAGFYEARGKAEKEFAREIASGIVCSSTFTRSPAEKRRGGA